MRLAPGLGFYDLVEEARTHRAYQRLFGARVWGLCLSHCPGLAFTTVRSVTRNPPLQHCASQATLLWAPSSLLALGSL